MIVLWKAKKEGYLAKKEWLPNIIAGIIVGVVALPLAMAFAIASGVKPEQGIYTAIVAGFCVSIFGGSRFQIAGPTGAFVVLLFGIASKYGVEGMQIATLMAGVILLCLGLAKFGGVIKYIPAPVIVGFTAGIGVVIWVGQWGYFLGLPKVQAEHFHQLVWQLLQKIPSLHLETTLLAGATLAIILLFPRVEKFKKLPSPLVAMIVATLIQSYFKFDGVATIGSAYGGIPIGLPELSFPKFNWNQAFDLIGPAFTIAMLGAIESLLSAVVADGMTGSKHDSNQELIGQGIANICTPLVGGIAATGAIARTATNIRNGGTSPIAGIVHGLVLVLVLLLLAPLAANIPLAAMAAILFVVAYNMSEVHHFIHMVRVAPRSDVVILLITFLLTVFAELVVAVNVGVLLANFHFMQKMTSAMEVHLQSEDELCEETAYQEAGKLPTGVLVYSIEGPFFFGAVENFERALAQTHTDPKALIIRLGHVPFVDMTGLETLVEVIGKLRKRGIAVFVCEANSKVRERMHRAGIFEILGRGKYWKRFSSAMIRCQRLLKELDERESRKEQ